MPSRFLLQSPARPAAAAAPPPEPLPVDSDVVVILAALLCAVICVAGLSLVARCAWLRRSASSPLPPPNKGLKKKVIQSLPKLPFDSSSSAAGGGGGGGDCPICLAEFAEGEVIRVLPQCGHGFHVGCVDTWLGSNSSCPSCRRIPVAPCRECGAASGGAAAEGGDKGGAFLP